MAAVMEAPRHRQGWLGAEFDRAQFHHLPDRQHLFVADMSEHPDRNKVFSCLGGLVDPVIDLSRRTPLRNGDILVLCTDGVWSGLTQSEMATWPSNVA